MGFFTLDNLFAQISINGLSESFLLPTILNMTLTSSVVILFVLLARLVLKKAPKAFSYTLWGVVLFRLLCPVSVTTDFSLLGLFDTPAVENTQHTSAVEYIPYDIVHTHDLEIQLPIPPAINGAVNEVLPQEHAELGADPLEGEFAIGSMVWLLGVSAMVIYSTVSYIRLRRKLIGAVVLRDNIYLADGIGSPFVMGIFRPKIYLPSTLSEQEQGYIILHEQHHVRRGDHIIKVLAFIALCIHWFNPLVWVAFVLSSKDMEMSCDEAVVKKLGVGIRTDYSASLLSLATGRRIIAGTPLAFGEGDTKSRIKNMINWKRPKAWITIVAAVICVAVVAACAANPTGMSEKSDETNNAGNGITDSQDELPAEQEASTDSMGLLGKWVLDGSYTENANNGLSLRNLFGTALGDYGASLLVNADGSIEYYIGVLSGKGTWRTDGDTGRYVADFVVYPDEIDEALTFYEFSESPDSVNYLVLDYGDYLLYWTKYTTDGAISIANDAVYYLELAAGENFRNMNSGRLAEILAEYEGLLDDYTLIARETENNETAYIVGQYTGAENKAPLQGMYSMEIFVGSEDMWQVLYHEEDSEAIESALNEQKKPTVGYQIANSYIHYSPDGALVLIQPKDTEIWLDVAWNRYMYTPNGREYIADAVSRGIDVCGRTDTYLYVYMISERYGEIAERIALTEAEAKAILTEERVNITDGFGFSATLHFDGQTTYYNEREGIPQTILDLAVEKCDYRFGDPSYITDTIREARLDCDWLDAPLYANEDDLPRLREILKNAEHGYVGSCGYGAKLTLTFTGGEKLTVFKGCDGCDTIVFGSYGGYFLGDKENTEFWRIFGLDPDTKELNYT